MSRSMSVRAMKTSSVLKQLLEEMNSDVAAAEAAELDHKKTFDELSDTKNEEIVASTQQHKEKSLEAQETAQETKLSSDRNTTELERTQESLGELGAFLANLGQLDIWEIQTIAESIEILHENEDQARDHFSKTNSSSLLLPTCKASPSLGRGSAFGVWLESRAELEKSTKSSIQLCKNYSQNVGHAVENRQGVLKRRSAVLMLLRDIVSSLRSIQRVKCWPQSVKTCEQSRETQSSCDFDRANDTHRGLARVQR